ncbi:MAG: hypothetical protein WCA32_01485 [Chromatiaceae bacterium]|jgi:hypothetical protein
MRAIELETDIPADGKLPEVFRPAFGHRARIIVLLPETEDKATGTGDQSARLMAFANQIDWPIDDPVAWQQAQRAEWDQK